jgi:hypothetical protein
MFCLQAHFISPDQRSSSTATVQLRIFPKRKVSNTYFIVYIFGKVFVTYLGHAVAQLVEALRYKPEGCGFDI